MSDLKEAKVVGGEGYSSGDGRGGILEEKMAVIVKQANGIKSPLYRVFAYPLCPCPEEREKKAAKPVLTLSLEAYPLGMGYAVVGSKLYMFGGDYMRSRAFPTKLEPSMDTYEFDLAASASASADVLKLLPSVSLNGRKFCPCTAVIEKGGKECICALRACFQIPSVDGPNFEFFDPESKSWYGLPDPSPDVYGYDFLEGFLVLQGCYVCKSRLYIWIKEQGLMLDLDNCDKGWSSFTAPIPMGNEINPPRGFAIGDGTLGWWPTARRKAFSWQPIGESINVIDVPVTFSPAQEKRECPYPIIPLWHARVGDRYLCIVESLSDPHICPEMTKDLHICISVYSICSADTSGVALHKICQSELVIESTDSLYLNCFVASCPNSFSDSQIWKLGSSVTLGRKRSRNAPDMID